ncbi:MAG: hypothetical protein IKT32_00530 [Clostridia bacterium]|nr:hypothetical protein [Clostridia bacterium]
MSISFEAVSVTPQTVKTGESFLLSTKIKAGYTNLVPTSIGTDKKVYNNGLGYKSGYRIRSGGAEQVKDGGSCTGFIPVKPNDVVRVSGWNIKESGAGACNAINISDANFNNLGQWAANNDWGYGNLQGTNYAKQAYMVEETTGVYKWVVPPAEYGAAYIRVSGFTGYGDTGYKMIVTVNEEIE